MTRVTIGDFFGSGRLVRHREHRLVSLLRGHRVGTIAVPSGALRVGDPADLESAPTLSVPRGRHEVFFAAEEMDSGHDGVGLLVRVRRGEPTRWRKVRVVGTDSAMVALGDARARCSSKQLATPRSTTAWRAGPSLIVASIGSDGGWPLYEGTDARGRLLALAVVTRRPDDFEDFAQATGTPPVDVSSLDACLAWAAAIGGDDALVRAGKPDLAPLRKLRALPKDLRAFYAKYTPYLGADHPAFLALVARQKLGRALPVSVDGPGSAVFLDEAGRVVTFYEGSTLGTALDLRAWALLSTIAVHDVGK